MTEPGDTGAPMRWDPAARGGVGGWVAAAGDGGVAPGGPAGRGVSRRAGRQRVILALSAGLLAGASVVVAVVHWRPAGSSAGPRPASGAAAESSVPPPYSSEKPMSPSAGGAGQAGAVDELLSGSAAARQQVVDSVRAIEGCASESSLAQAQGTLLEAAGRRDTAIAQLDFLDVELIAGGAEAVAALRSAWEHSAAADRAFADWGAAAAGCTPGAVEHGADFIRAGESSALATEKKRTFVGLWTPIAARYGLPRRAEDRL